MPPRTKTPAATKRKPVARKTTRKPRTPRQPAPEQVTSQPQSVTEEERQALLTAYTTLKAAGLEVPANIAEPVEVWIVEEQERRAIEDAERAQYQTAIEEENSKGPWYVRNCYRAPFSMRLDRQTEGRRVSLERRGDPGDLYPLQDEDLKDAGLKRNVQLGVIEVIPAGEANRVMDHQTHNPGIRVHTPTAILMRPDGKPYDDPNPVKVDVSEADRGIIVGYTDPAQIQGGVSDRDVGGRRSWGGVTRAQPGQPAPQREVAAQFIPTGGNPYIVQHGPIDKNTQAKIADDLARRKDVHGPAAGLGGVQVVVAPTQREQ